MVFVKVDYFVFVFVFVFAFASVLFLVFVFALAKEEYFLGRNWRPHQVHIVWGQRQRRQRVLVLLWQVQRGNILILQTEIGVADCNGTSGLSLLIQIFIFSQTKQLQHKKVWEVQQTEKALQTADIFETREFDQLIRWEGK